MKTAIRVTVLLAFAASALAAAAQTLPFHNIDLSSLERAADEMVEVNLDQRMLRLASAFLSDDKADEREIKAIVAGLTGIYVRSFTFDRDGRYDQALPEKIRRMVGPGWETMIRVRNKNDANIDVLLKPAGNSIDGLVVIAAEPSEFTIVNIIGRIDLEKLSRLEGQFGVPDLDLGEVGRGRSK